MVADGLERQHLRDDALGTDVVQVARDVVGLHATGAPNPYLQLLVRCVGFDRSMRRELSSGAPWFVPAACAARFCLAARPAADCLGGYPDKGPERLHGVPGIAGADCDGVRAVGNPDRGPACRTGAVCDPAAFGDAGWSGGPGFRRAEPDVWRGSATPRPAVAGWRDVRNTYRRFSEALPHVQLVSCSRAEATRTHGVRPIHWGNRRVRDRRMGCPWSGVRRAGFYLAPLDSRYLLRLFQIALSWRLPIQFRAGFRRGSAGREGAALLTSASGCRAPSVRI